MAWNTSTVTLGSVTKKSDYDRLRLNDQTIASSTFTFNGPKVWNGLQTINSATLFKKKITFTATAIFNGNRLNSAGERIYNWYKVVNPSTGYFKEKTDAWNTDNFTTGWTVDFSTVVTAGTIAVKCAIYLDCAGAGQNIYARKYGDTNISNTPNASAEYSSKIFYCDAKNIVLIITLWLDSSYRCQIAADRNDPNVYISYPIEELR
jgi:hypothetical protein